MGGSTGWRRDPFQRHEWRYVVDGEPTAAVADAGLLSEDPPPQDVPQDVLEPAAVVPAPLPPDAPVHATVPRPVVDQPAGDVLTVPVEAPGEPVLPAPSGAEGATEAARLDRGREEDAPPEWVLALHRWLVAALPLLGVYVAVRVGLLIADVLSAHVGFGGALSGPLLSWDAHWYVQIAEHGYPPHPSLSHGQLTYSAANFLPFFPILIKAVGLLGFSPVVAASMVSWVSGAAATLLVWRLGAMAFDESTGTIAAILFMVFPGWGIGWGALYSECVGVTLVAGFLLLLLRRGGGAGLVGFCATLTSPMAVVPLTAAAVVATFQAARRRESLLAPVLAVVLTPLGFFGYALWIGTRYNDVLFYWHLGHQVWGTSIDFGHSLFNVLTHPLTQGFLGPGWLNWVGLAAVIGAIVAMVKARLPAVVSSYTAVLFLQLAMTDVLGFRPRNLTWAFPALISVAALTRRRAWQAVAIGFAVLLPVVFLAYTNIGNTMGAP